MRKFKRSYNTREVERMLRKNGWTVVRKTGSHKIYKNKNGEHMTVKSSSFNPMIFQRLIKENNLNV